MGEFGDLSLLVGFGDLRRRTLEDGRAGGSASLLLLVGLNDLGRRVSDVGSLFRALKVVFEPTIPLVVLRVLMASAKADALVATIVGLLLECK